MMNRWIVETQVGESRKREVWNTGTPFRLPNPVRATLERRDGEVVITAPNGEGVTVTLPENFLTPVTLVQQAGLVIQLRPAREISFDAPRDLSVTEDTFLYVMAGRGRRLLATEEIRDVSVGSVEQTTIFRLFRKQRTLRLVANVENLYLASSTGALEPGREVVIDEDDKRPISLRWNNYWWNFSWVNPADFDDAEGKVPDVEAKWLKSSGVVASAVSAICLIAFALVNGQPKTSAPIAPATEDAKPVVTVEEIPEMHDYLAERNRARLAEASNSAPLPVNPAIAAPAPVATPAPTAPPQAREQSVADRRTVKVAPPKVSRNFEKKSQAAQRAFGALAKSLGKMAVPEIENESANPTGKKATAKVAAATKVISGAPATDETSALRGQPLLGRVTQDFRPGEAGVGSLGDAADSSDDGRSGAGRKGAAREQASATTSYRRGAMGATKIAGQGRSLIRLKLDGAAIAGELTRQEVDAVIQTRIGEIRRCYEAATRDNESYQGRVLVHFKILNNGGTSAVSVDGSENFGSTLRNCLTSDVGTWRFPKPRAGGEVEVSYPFVFTTLEGDS